MSRIFFRLRIVFIVTDADDYHMQMINFIFVNYIAVTYYLQSQQLLLFF